jgi:hypothetical protein
VTRFSLLAIVLALGLCAPAFAQPEPTGGTILAPVARQAAWLSLDAPRPRPVTHYLAPAYVADVDVSATGSAVLAVYSPLHDRIGGDLFRLDPATGALEPLVMRADERESLGAPAWSGGRIVFQREDLSAPAIGYAWQTSARFPSRIDVVDGDGSARGMLVDDARQPGASADGTLLTYLRASPLGSALLVRAVDSAEERELIAAGTFIDLATPRFSPTGDQIAFAVATPFVGRGPNLLEALFGVSVAHAHGLPWDVWLIGADGSNPRLLATLGADDPSLTWSPDGRQIFAYGGTGSFIVDAATGDLASYPYLAGYGAAAWTR